LLPREEDLTYLDFFLAHSETEFFISSITASELLHGVERANTVDRQLRRSRYVEDILREFPVIEFNTSVAREHARLWARLEARGQAIGAHDMLIAATALHGQHWLATLNRDEFAQVERLQLSEVASFATS
jgi:tRNA(fMet)-specific endonuclease VapC